MGQQQRVEIIKALYRGAQIIILDEPTGVLTPAEAEQLFRALAELRRQGRTILLITHKLKEIMAITDHVSVMRRGEMVAHRKTSETNPQELAELMVGRPVGQPIRTPGIAGKDVLLEVRNLSVTDARGVLRVDNLSFSVRAGEILGLAACRAMASPNSSKAFPG